MSLQESRRIFIAQYQRIVFGDYLPTILSDETRTKHDLQLSPESTYSNNVDPTIKNEFGTAAYRFGHSLVQVRFMDLDF